MDLLELLAPGELVAELEADVEADAVPFRSKNFCTPARCISFGVQNVLTFD